MENGIVDVSTLNEVQKTDAGVLPQHQPLEARVADKPRGWARNVPGQTAVVQHSRGERGGSAKAAPVTAGVATGASGVSRVFVLDAGKRPLMPTTPARARRLLKSGRAVVARRFPFTIRLKNRKVEESKLQPVSLKLDPGSKTTGIALVRVHGDEQHVLHLADLHHRGDVIRKRMTQRASYRRRRRSSNLRYRAPRFNNRRRREGWLPPSLNSRVDNVSSWFNRYRKLVPLTDIAVETVRFDTQALENPEISGVEHQQGTLFGYELREYLLEKFGRTCVYCDARNVPLQIEHVVPRSGGGSNRVSNLTLACSPCNQRKDSQDVREFLAHDPKRLSRVLSQLKSPLKDAAAVNATRWALVGRLRAEGLPVSIWSSGRTKFNRQTLNIPKAHALDAACVGEVEHLHGWQQPVLSIKACGRGSYQRTRLTAQGFPRGYLMRQKQVRGFCTGDMVRAVVPTGKKQGNYVGRVAVRATGSFNIQTSTGTIQGISWRHCQIIARGDGYAYSAQSATNMPLLPSLKEGVSEAGVN